MPFPLTITAEQGRRAVEYANAVIEEFGADAGGGAFLLHSMLGPSIPGDEPGIMVALVFLAILSTLDECPDEALRAGAVGYLEVAANSIPGVRMDVTRFRKGGK